MNGTEDRVVAELRRGLRERVEGMQPAPAGVVAVRDRARRIRTRRRVTTGVVVAACLAVAVPVALSISSGSEDRGVPVVDEITEGTPPGPDELGIFGIKVGAEPGIAWLRDGVVHHPDGSESAPDVAGQVTSFAHLPGSDRHVLVSANGQGDQQVEVIDGSGKGATSYPSSWDLAVSSDGAQVAWGTPDGEIMVLRDDRDEPIRLGTFEDDLGEPYPVAILGDDCSDRACAVLTNLASDDGADRRVAIMGTDGVVAFLEDLIVTSGGIERGQLFEGGVTSLVAGTTEVSDDGSCSRIDDSHTPGGGDRPVETCDHSFGQFSPDGVLIEASPAYRSGLGDGVIGMYDVATGSPLWSRQATEEQQAFIHSTAWEDATHLLAVAHQDGQWAVLRFGADGSIEQALPPVKGEETEPAYLLETRP